MAYRLLGARLATKPKLDALWLALFMGAILIFVYLTTYNSIDSGIAGRGVVGFMILIAGVVGSLLFTGFNTDNFLDFGDLSNIIGGGIASVVLIGFVNFLGQRIQLSTSPIDSALFAMLVGVAEEQFFRGFILTAINRQTGNSVLGVIISSAIGAIYHSAVYGVSNNLILIVFASFAVLGFIYVASGYRLSVPMVGHAAINALAYLGG